ncbi:MAG TPA: hypothetical protein VNO43_09695 [Candidatus Eisenbacteria bacterium]|nr:hypothetical protein [Candidatus Eisenbacteria bacterium]
MRMRVKFFKCLLLASALLVPSGANPQAVSFKEIESRIAEYGRWLDQVGSNGSRYWLRLDSSKRPHRLYVGEAFMQASYQDQERFVEIFSRFLAGHPERNMLIDIFDARTGKAIGEYGFGGFKLFP